MSAFFGGVSVQQLGEIPLFAGLNDDTLETIRSTALFIGAHPGYKIVRQGQSARDLYVIESGEVEVVRDGDVLAMLGVGEVFGEMALLGADKRSADVVAKGVVSLVTMSAHDYRAIVAEHPEVEQRLQELAESRRG